MPHPGSHSRKSLSSNPCILASESKAWPPLLAISVPGNPLAYGPSALLQQRPVQRESGNVSSDGLAGNLARLFLSSGAQPSSHRPLCEAVGRRPLSPAVFSYPSDIQLFLREEAHFWQLVDLDSRKLCLTPFLFVSNQPVPLYHFPLGCVSPPAALSHYLSCCHLYTTLNSSPAREEDK